ncbi:ABC transporter permease [Herbiconiux moechotypicola]|uniref:Autoinducer 2 import system permease protein LsrC n=1 Tax=Herbiconiux moechotypicola TaxID=637393 RepID=A0ABN3DP18_9MICO|nr:ABC transporter permease [Herbiconiux moechotypicola]MCS5730434.1 ABC transporter permease [Herbiconiux moechotypicola]
MTTSLITPADPAAPVSPGGRKGRPDSRGATAWRDALSIAGVWLLLIVATTIVRPDFLSSQTLLAVTFTMAISGILAVSQALIVISGGLLDLSLPVSLILSAWATVTALNNGLPTWVAIPIGIVTGAAWGLLNGLIVVFGKLNPIIVTLATGFGGLAIMLIFFKSAQIPSTSELRLYGLGRFLGLPNVFWPMVIVIVLAGLALTFTRWGRHLRAVGGNAQAAKARGIDLRRMRLATFAGAGAVAGLAGVMFSAVNPSFTPASGAGFQLIVIGAVILGGISLSGGKGNLLVLLLSVGFLATIPTSIAFFGLAPAWALVFQGALLIIAVGIDGYRLKRTAR